VNAHSPTCARIDCPGMDSAEGCGGITARREPVAHFTRPEPYTPETGHVSVGGPEGDLGLLLVPVEET
jgi:hypothetical protein